MREQIMKVAVALAMLAGLAPGGAVAGDKGLPRLEDRPGDEPGREKLRAEVIERWRTMRMWRITEALKLDEAGAAKLYPVLARFDEDMMKAGRERHEAYRELRRLLDAPTTDAGAVNAAMDRVQATQARRLEIENARFAALRKMLTPVQAGRLLMVLPDLENELRRRMHEAIRKSRGEPGEPSGPPGRRWHDGPDRGPGPPPPPAR